MTIEFAAANRLAVWAIGDDGFGNATSGAGAVYLFGFSGSNFTGGSHEATLGKGYVGGKNINVASLEAGDGFGSGVALNAIGNRLAVGVYQDDGLGNVAVDSGAVHLYGFADADYSGGSLQAMIGKGYSGGNHIDVAALEAQDAFGISVALNAVGDRLAVGAIGDDGAGNTATNSGAVDLFGFSDANFNAGALVATVGKGYTGGSDYNLTNLENADGFGRSVALNAVGDRLGAGAFNDGGAGNLALSSGAVYLLDFTDNNFSGASLVSTIGKGYAGTDDLNLTGLDAGDYFGTSLAFNATGDRLAVGAMLDDGAGNTSTNPGAVHLISLLPDPLPSLIGFSDYPGQTITILNTQLASTLSSGTNVVLQANNDITFASAVSVDNPTGDGGSLTLQAGRDIHFDASIATDNGDLVAVAGDPSANMSERDPGTATINIATGVTLDAGSGNVTLASVDGVFVNNSGSANPIQANRWFVYSADPANNSLAGMIANKHYNQPYIANSVPAYAISGNWLFYSIAPVLAVTPQNQTVNYGDAPNPFSYSFSGFIDGDTAGSSAISGTGVFSGVSAAPGIHNIQYTSGFLSGLGYSFSDNALSTGELTVLPQTVAGDVAPPPNEASQVYVNVVLENEATRKLIGGCSGAGSFVGSASLLAAADRFRKNEIDFWNLEEKEENNTTKKH